MALTFHERLEAQRHEAQPEAKQVPEFRGYFRGRQRSTLSRDQGRIMRGLLGHLFAHNLCAKIVTTTADRHELLRFQVEDEAVAAFLDGLWVRNQLSRLQADAAIATLRDGTHAIALRWEAPPGAPPGSGRVAIHRERWWDGTQGVWIAYGDDGEPAYAVKDWTERRDDGTKQERRIVWWPDRMQRFVRDNDGWKSYRLAGDPASSAGVEIPWTKRDGRPLGIPVIAFPNGSDDDTPYGKSELDGGVLGLQDEINDVQRDITASARLTGYQMYYATGVSPDLDPQGKPKPLAVGPGQTLQHPNPDARYGVLPAGDLAQLKGALMTKIEAVCSMTDTPLHVITGDWPSGAALLRAEMPLVAKVSRLNKTEGPQWSTVTHRATEMHNTFGAGEQLDEDSLITAVWAPPERLDALTQAQIAQARLALGTDRQALREIGFAEDEIDTIVTERAADRDEREAALERRFNATLGSPRELGQGEDDAA